MVKNGRKMAQNWPKTNPKRTQNLPRKVVKWVKNSQIWKNCKNVHKWLYKLKPTNKNCESTWFMNVSKVTAKFLRRRYQK